MTPSGSALALEFMKPNKLTWLLGIVVILLLSLLLVWKSGKTAASNEPVAVTETPRVTPETEPGQPSATPNPQADLFADDKIRLRLGISEATQQAYLDYRRRKGISGGGFTWMDVTDLPREKLDRIMFRVRPEIDGVVDTGASSPAGRRVPPTYPLSKNSAVTHFTLNSNMTQETGPMAAIEVDDIFVISTSRGPPDDFSKGVAVVAATGQIIGWGLPSPEQEEAIKNAPVRDPWDTRGARSGGGGP
jgi:hypothetical protein